MDKSQGGDTGLTELKREPLGFLGLVFQSIAAIGPNSMYLFTIS
ncbi:MAG: hypothetical protein ACP5LW_05055 [Nitrososphaeria archaeon]